MENSKKISEYLGSVQYDRCGQYFWAKHGDKMQLVAELRGWGRIQNMFKTVSDAADFQDEVGLFIAEAINEKLKSLTTPPRGTTEKQ